MTLEQVIEVVRALPLGDRYRLQEWLQKQERRDLEEPRREEAVRREIEKYKLAKQWIAEHRVQYLGQWVALEGDRLIAYGANAVQVDNEAKAAGIEVPFVVRVIDEEPKYFYAGW